MMSDEKQNTAITTISSIVAQGKKQMMKNWNVGDVAGQMKLSEI